MLRSLAFLMVIALCVAFAPAQISPVASSYDPEAANAETRKTVEKVPQKAPERIAVASEKHADVVTPAPQPKPLPPGAPVPKIGCLKPSFDFGEMGQNEEVIHDFEIENVGKGDLEILSATGSCGCTAVAAPNQKVLKPGEKTTINVNFKTLNNNGPISKPVTVSTNDPVTPNYVLTVSGKVTQPFRPSLTEVNFGTLRKGTAVAPKTFEILTNSSQSIVEVKTDSEQVKVSFEPIPVEEKRAGYRFTVKVEGALPVGQLRATITVGTTVPSQKAIMFPVLGTVEGEITLKPRTLSFAKVKLGEAATRTVEIEKAGTADLKIEEKDIKVSPEGAFTAKLEEVKKGQSYKIVIGIAPGAKEGYSRGTVSIKTNCPGETDLQVYFYALLQP